MNKIVPIGALLVVVAAGAFLVGRQTACAQPVPQIPPTAPQSAPVNVTSGNSWVYFSPKGGCTEAVVAELEKAKESVLIQAYSFTSDKIAKAAVDAHKRGVKVQAILDKSQRSEKYSELDFLARAGIPTKVDATHAIAHNKIMVIDGETVITGSFNFTKAAEEKNAENLLIIKDKKAAEVYAKNWQTHAGHSEDYTAK